MKIIALSVAFLLAGLISKAQEGEIIITNAGSPGYDLTIEFSAGPAHNHPLMAIWMEDLDGHFIQTLYVAESIATSVFRHGDKSDGKWKPGLIRRPAALPYWGRQRGIKADDGLYIPTPENPVPDALTGPTPQSDFILKSNTADREVNAFRVLFEINQPWDWNDHWTNGKFPDDYEYLTSAQPAVVYAATIDLDNPEEEYLLEPIGHSHYAGANGELYEDLSTLSTALKIAESIRLTVELDSDE